MKKEGLGRSRDSWWAETKNAAEVYSYCLESNGQYFQHLTMQLQSYQDNNLEDR